MLDQKTFDEFHGTSRLNIRWNHPDNFLKLASMGIFIPYADAFEYNGDGILLIGNLGYGKTSTTGRFVGFNNKNSKRRQNTFK